MPSPIGGRSRRFASASGQTTTEWLLVAGTLTALVALILTIVPRALGVFVRGIAVGVRTIAP